MLVHSDLTVTDEKLKVIAPSFFAYQKVSPQRRALPQLLVQNNVTGGAVMLNRPLLELLKTLLRSVLCTTAWLALVACCFGVNLLGEGAPLLLPPARRQRPGSGEGGQSGGVHTPAGGRQRGQGELPENVRPGPVPAGTLRGPAGRGAEGGFRGIYPSARRSRIGKIAEILRWGFTKNTWIRTLGQMMMIGD